MTHIRKYFGEIAAAVILCLTAVTTDAQTFFSHSWTDSDQGLPDGWTTVGTDKTPSGEGASHFKKEGWKVMENEAYPSPFAASFSSTEEGGKVETWLISPELDVPQCGGFIEFPSWTSGGGSTACKMTVRISLSGSSTDDFNQSPLLTTRIKPADGISLQSINLSEFAGKSIRLAILNEGTQAGMLCIGNLTGYICKSSVSNSTPLIAAPGQFITVKLNLDIRAVCNGFDATITTSTGKTSSSACNKNLSEGLNNYKLSFSCGAPDNDVLSYTVTITPRLEAATPIVVTGSTAISDGFPQTCLMEEGTGENCGYCPAGVAAIERFRDMYPDRFFGVGIHCTEAFSTGVMENPEYADPFVRNLKINSLPSAVLNRSVTTSPSDFNSTDSAVKKILDGRSAARVVIDRVDCDMQTGETCVSFTSEMCAPLTGVQINACAILSADNLTGTSRKWFQSNYFSGMSKEDFLKQADVSWWPYMKFWCEYPSQKVSPSDRMFNDVAMGVYPDFDGQGCHLPSDWNKTLRKSESISFIMPMQQEYDGFGVQKIENTAVSVVLVNGGDGTVIAATQVKAKDYNKQLSGVEYTVNNDASVRIENNRLIVYTPEVQIIDIFSADGRQLYSGKADAGESALDLVVDGFLIVRLNNKTFKLLAM